MDDTRDDAKVPGSPALVAHTMLYPHLQRSTRTLAPSSVSNTSTFSNSSRNLPWKGRNITFPGTPYVAGVVETSQELQLFELNRIYRSSHFGLLAVRHTRQDGVQFLRITVDHK